MAEGKAKNVVMMGFLVLIALWSVQSVRNISYNWDLIPYMACVFTVQNNNVPFQQIHHRVYQEIKESAPDNTYQYLIGAKGEPPHSTYRATVFEDPDALRQQLPLYSIRVGYIYLVSILFKLTGEMILSISLVSAIAFALTGIVTLFWLARYIDNWIFYLVLLIYLFWRCFLLESARFATPDALLHALTLLAVYIMLEPKRLHVGAIFLLLTVIVRPDNAVLVLFLLGACLLSGRRKIETGLIASYMVAAFTLYVAINWVHNNYGWKMLIHFELVGPVAKPAEYDRPFPLVAYLRGIANYRAILNSEYLLFLSTSLVLAYRLVKRNALRVLIRNENIRLLVALHLYWWVRWFLIPSLLGRHFVSTYILFGLLLIRVVCELPQIVPDVISGGFCLRGRRSACGDVEQQKTQPLE